MNATVANTIRVHRFLPRTWVEGPGLRAALWVQGCSIRCPGCFQPQTWSKHGGVEMTPEEVFRMVRREPDLEGITLVGGEPFEQAGPLAVLAQLCRQAGLGVLTFSGLTFEGIRGADRADYDALLATTDLLLAGPFVATKADTSRPWVGSSNQTFHFLTGRYVSFRDSLTSVPNQLEWRVSPEGQVSLNGLADDRAITQMSEELAGIGLHLTA